MGGRQAAPRYTYQTADQLDALSAERPYRGKLPPEKGVAILREERGPGLDPDCVDAAIATLEFGN